MARKPAAYTNESITSLKGADRVRKRPGVIFGSDGVDGCAHSIFEILSNAIDEALPTELLPLYETGKQIIVLVMFYLKECVEVTRT